MPDTDIFQNKDIPPAPTVNSSGGATITNHSPNDALVDLLRSITNENGEPKYDSVEKAIEALRHSQEHIRRLEDERKRQDEELNRMREDEANKESVEQIVDRILAAKDKPNTPVQATPLQNGSVVDENAVGEVVQRIINTQRAKEAEASNYQSVQSALIQKYGDKVGEVIAAKASELGTTPEEIGALAKKSPKMVLSLFNTSAVKSSSPVTSSVNLPLTPENREPERPKLEKSILQGATMKDQMDAFARSKAYTKQRLGVTD